MSHLLRTRGPRPQAHLALFLSARRPMNPPRSYSARRDSALLVLLVVFFGSGCRSFPRVLPGANEAHDNLASLPEPELVQPGVISSDREETFPSIDPVDGSLWFSTYEGEGWNQHTIMRAPRYGSGWGPPVAVFPEGDEWRGRALRFSPDGQRLYFTSNRSVSPGGERADLNI